MLIRRVWKVLEPSPSPLDEVAPSLPDSTVYDKNNLLTQSSKLHEWEGTEAGVNESPV